MQEYQNELNENEIQIRKLVLESYNDIALEKEREYNNFFDELESRHMNEKVWMLHCDIWIKSKQPSVDYRSSLNQEVCQDILF